LLRQSAGFAGADVAAVPRAAPVAPPQVSNPEEVRRVANVGISPTGTSAIEEAKSLSPEGGYAPAE
jgi:hypothetical protein